MSDFKAINDEIHGEKVNDALIQTTQPTAKLRWFQAKDERDTYETSWLPPRLQQLYIGSVSGPFWLDVETEYEK